jgi:hypothetical protein
MWWATGALAKESGGPSKTVGAQATALNRKGLKGLRPTQMAIPLRMD